MEKGDKEELYNIFYTFAMTLLMDFNNYLNGEDYNLIEDKVGFRSFPLYLSDEESDEFFNEIRTALAKVVDYKPEGNRRLRKFSYSIMPVEENERGK